MYSFADDASDNPTFYAELDNPQSLNKYQYTYNNPLSHVDPDGHGVWAVVAAAVEVVGTVVDVVNTVQTIRDPKASAAEKVATVVGTAAGLALPAGGYSFGAKIVKQAVKREAKVAKRANDAIEVGADVKSVHGNSASSTKPQHGYEIVDQTGDVKKVGVSGQKLNQNGTSPRANPQVNQANKTRTGTNQVKPVIRQTNVNSRKQILEWEKKQAAKRRQEGNSMDMQKRP